MTKLRTVFKYSISLPVFGALMGCASVDKLDAPKIAAWNDPALNNLVLPELQKFSDERELRAYMRDVHRAAKKKDAWWAMRLGGGTTKYAQVATEECEEEDGCVSGEVIVTGSRVKSSSKSSSITNNQKAGVDEGDIVKNFGRFLIVLQDGRLFSVDTGTSARDMKMVDRIDAYRDENASTWFDEMLIYENRIVVTGYSYEENASELAIIRISPDGKFSHEATFFLASDDYYDIENYASRLVDGNLVLHTPLDLTEEYNSGKVTFPKISKWTRKDGMSEFRQLYHATDVYYPIQKTLYPTMHAVSVCPLAGKKLRCKTTAVIAPSRAEYYVSEDNAYLWVEPATDRSEQDIDSCNMRLEDRFGQLDDRAADIKFDGEEGFDDAQHDGLMEAHHKEYKTLGDILYAGHIGEFFDDLEDSIAYNQMYDKLMTSLADRPGSAFNDIYTQARTALEEWKTYPVTPSAAYQFSIKNAGRNNSLKAVFTKGMPSDQFALETNDNHFRALVEWEPAHCYLDRNSSTKKYVNFSLSKFKRRPPTLAEQQFVRVPSLPVWKIENRFTANYLVYGGRESWSSRPPRDDGKLRDGQVVAIPVNNPQNATKISVPHNVIRIEAAGENIIATGYRSGTGLSISSVDLRNAPKLADTKKLYGRYESEGRSHAFNADIKESGSGIFGLPTVTREKSRWRWWSYSETSDVNFLTLDEDLKLTDVGRLKASEDPVHEDYECEVSCIDWYGNTRPIFMDGRIFALSATELVEGKLSGGRMVEVGRVNLSEPVEHLTDERRAAEE